MKKSQFNPFLGHDPFISQMCQGTWQKLSIRVLRLPSKVFTNYNHRMVTSFGCSSKVLQLFEHAQVEPLRKGRKMSWVAGITTGLSPCLLYLSWALDFLYGGKLVQSGEISAADFFKTYFILMTTGKLIAEAGSMTSDLAKGANAVASVFEVLDRKSPQNLQVHIHQ